MDAGASERHSHAERRNEFGKEFAFAQGYGASRCKPRNSLLAIDDAVEVGGPAAALHHPRPRAGMAEGDRPRPLVAIPTNQGVAALHFDVAGDGSLLFVIDSFSAFCISRPREMSCQVGKKPPTEAGSLKYAPYGFQFNFSHGLLSQSKPIQQ
ncbi:MAG: hypothetical protein GY859_38045 [Desulfobacterales bacterium]|nr:hypothetical protein [Desulfobacterales bacterium]